MLVRQLPALEQRLNELSVPTTVVVGSADRVVPPAAARELANAIAGAHFEVLDRAGHLLPQQNAKRLAVLIAEQLARR